MQQILDVVCGDNDIGTEDDDIGDIGADDDTESSHATSEEEYASDDDVPFAQPQQKTVQRKYRWRTRPYNPPQVNFHGPPILPTDPTGITETALQYFRQLVTHDMLELKAE